MYCLFSEKYSRLLLQHETKFIMNIYHVIGVLPNVAQCKGALTAEKHFVHTKPDISKSFSFRFCLLSSQSIFSPFLN